jgi:hypothetical protein
MTSYSSSETIVQKKRGRKPAVLSTNEDNKIILKQHNFNYSDEFATELTNFAISHLEDTNKKFKSEWKEWMDSKSLLIKNETDRIKSNGYLGSVEEKMYFSARYYYRKKAIKERNNSYQEEKEEETKPKRKKYECSDKETMIQMNNHIVSQIYSLQNCDIVDGNMISKLSPSDSFAKYCDKYGISEEDLQTKKIYKNLYWRISIKTKASK